MVLAVLWALLTLYGVVMGTSCVIGPDRLTAEYLIDPIGWTFSLNLNASGRNESSFFRMNLEFNLVACYFISLSTRVRVRVSSVSYFNDREVRSSSRITYLLTHHQMSISNLALLLP